MKTRQEIERYLERDRDEYEVIVAGGGPAGIGAAVAAALRGRKTLLLEASGSFGGVAPLALWMPVNRLLKDGASRGGAHRKLVEAVQAFGPDASREGKRSWVDGDGLHIHPDYLKLAVFELLESVGCTYRLHSPVTGVRKEGRDIQAVECLYKGKSMSYLAKVFIDATGDGDVAFLAGAEYMEGREEDGVHMPVSLVFAVSGVDTEKFYAYHDQHNGELKEIFAKAAGEGYYTAHWYSFDRTTVPGVVSINNGAFKDQGSLDGTDTVDMTMAERFGIAVAVDFVKIARAYRIPGMENCHLVRTGAAAAIRDTRRIKGEYVQTLEDATQGSSFPDVVARKYGAIDANQLYIGKMESGFTYPYRSMLPLNLDNLLLAGRCGSATFLGHASGKSMGNMMALGQAAGTAAALSVEGRTQPRKLEVEAIQEGLRAIGAVHDV